MKIKNKDGLTAPDLLLQYGAQGMLVATSGGTVTAVIGSSGNIGLPKRAVELGANVNAQFYDKQTILHQAAGSGNVVLAEFLLQHKANVNAQDASGQTPAHYAAGSGRIDMLNLLVKNGADMKIKNKDGLVAPDLLLQYGAQGMLVATPGGTVTAVIGSSENIGLLKRAVELGANVNAQFSRKQTALHLAAGSNNLVAAEFLLQQKANVNAQDEDGDTPAHKAAYNNNKIFIALLAKHGANMALKNNEDKTAKEILASQITGTKGGNATVAPAKKQRKTQSKRYSGKRPAKILTPEQKKNLDARIERARQRRTR